MARRAAALATVVCAATLALAGCGGPAASPIDDPIDILVQSVQTIQDAKSVHLKLTLDGEVAIGDLAGGLLPGASPSPGSSGGTIAIDGTTVEGDIDVANGAARLEFAVPALMNTSGEVIIVDDAIYVKVSLLGDKYHVFDSADAGGLIPGLESPVATASPAATDPAGELRLRLEGLDTPPVKLADEQCGDATCYRVQVKLDPTDTESLSSLAPDIAGSGTLDVWVRKNDLRPSQITFTADAGDQGNVTATLVFSAWDASVDIKAPPEDQVTEGSFGLPGLMPSATP